VVFDAQCDLAAVVYGAGDDPDRLISDFAADLCRSGCRPVGVVQRGRSCRSLAEPRIAPRVGSSPRCPPTQRKWPDGQNRPCCDPGAFVLCIAEVGLRSRLHWVEQGGNPLRSRASKRRAGVTTSSRRGEGHHETSARGLPIRQGEPSGWRGGIPRRGGRKRRCRSRIARARLEPISGESRTSLCERRQFVPGKSWAKPETGTAFLATLADSGRQRPRHLVSPPIWPSSCTAARAGACRHSNRSLCATENSAGKRFAEARDWAGIFGDNGRFRAIETAISRVSGGKAAES
jgi:hypothetical protein